MMRIRFGTSGWRGVIAREFTWDNVNRVVDAIALFLQQEGYNSIVIGGDCRFLSPELAEAAAKRMAGYGFNSVLSDRPVPTPALSHTCIEAGNGGVINFTASHNPPLYNGIKFSPWHGGPADEAVTGRIEELIAGGHSPSPGTGRVTREDLCRSYIGSIQEYISESVFRSAGLRVVYDAFSGTGSGILDKILVNLGAAVRVMNGSRDPLFAGRQHPEPGLSGTADLAEEVMRSGASIGVATDGDADRFGLIDENGDYVSPHDFLPLLLEYLIEVKGMRGLVVRSVTTSSLLDRVASAHGLRTEVTPVGFKYLGARMLETEVLLAGEESGGLSILGHVPEKDGILACLLASEMVASRKQGLAEQLKALWREYGRVFVSRVDLQLGDKAEAYIRENFLESEPSEIAGIPVVEIDRTDGVRFIFPGGNWVLIRLSGTEPLARIYAQTESPGDTDEILQRITRDAADPK